jgi:hypothetical protein
MDARATLSGSQRSTARFPVTLVAAIVAALILGWFGGYLARGLAVSTPASNTVTTPRPFVVEPAPYSTPATSPVPEPTRDPNGNAFTI